jgi:tripartite-type tricarboxylate transporter receptor subunit TctC
MVRKEFTKVLMFFVVLLISCSPILSTATFAQEEFPSRPVDIVISFAPGGSTDLICRELADSGKKYLGQPLIVVNKPGGGGAVAAGFVYSAKPDGYTVGGFASAGVTLRPHLYKVPYELPKLTPIIQVAIYPLALVVRKEAPWNSLQELLTYARSHPNQIKFATTGLNDINHLIFEQVARANGVKWDCVPSTGEAPAIAMLLGGHIDFFAGGATWLPHIQAGTLKALVTYGGKKKFFPDIPTLQELGYDFPSETGPIIVGPPELPAKIVKRLHDGFKKAMDEPRFDEALKKINLQNEYRNSEELKQYISSFYAKWGVLIQEMGIKRKD